MKKRDSIVEIDPSTKVISNIRADGIVYAYVKPEWMRAGVHQGENVLTDNDFDTLNERCGVLMLVLGYDMEFIISAKTEFAEAI